MGRQIHAAGLHRAVALELKSNILPGVRSYQPAWFNVLHSVPPAESSVRTVSLHHGSFKSNPKRLRNLYRPKALFYLEDKLRDVFYRDHPWELARPRIIVESDGKDYQRCDWSKGVQQPGISLSGECVVQRQMWLMQNKQMSENEAYDEARHEFYWLRQAEHIEQRIAVEEARFVGAYFGKTRLDIGMMLEDIEFEKWKGWAIRENQLADAADQGLLDESILGADAGSELAEVEEEGAAAADDVAAEAEDPVAEAEKRKAAAEKPAA
ncbi:hypothetical protein XA68_10376 [Ophiocordyceps unilateralis]|uniref:Small ribosomal subunit protein mS23 n=1 Tax=Ophiocordyceps unilateralis TaxID=268505 RepID=A0A2A9PIL8_OPHUN|nr:hypothetical protein XA68_10376 [Ophiocordyceps unilateralis]